MKTLPAGMQSDLDGGVTFHCMAFRMVRSDGVAMGFTDHDDPLFFENTFFEPESGFTSSTLAQSVGLNVDDIEAFGFLKSDRIKESDIFGGVYDNAMVTVYRVDWKDPTKRTILLTGNIGEVARGRLGFVAEVRSLAHILNQPSGRAHLHTCDAKLFDKRCGANPEGTSDGIPLTMRNVPVAASSDRTQFTSTIANLQDAPAGWFDRGYLVWTTGNNANIKAEIKRYYLSGSNGVITLWEPLPNNIQAGDTYKIVAGCNKTIETCKAKFDNVLRFRGFPRMPTNDHVLVFAGKSKKNDGTSLFQ